MKLPSLVLKNNSLSNLNEAISREWIITNGLGGYSSSTALCINTRKYHGLLVTALHPPGNRRVCLAKLDEEINIENRIYPLGSNEFEGRVYPKGHTFLRESTVSPFPEFTYSLEDIQVKKTIVMPFEKNAILIRYRIRNKSNLNVKARIFPLINWRHFHSVTDHWKNPLKIESVQTSIGTDIIFNDPKSTSGFLFPMVALRKAGIKIEDFSEVEHVTRHANSLLAVYNKHVDAGAISSTAKEKVDIDFSKIKILWKSRPIYRGSWIANKDLSDEQLYKIQSALLRISNYKDAEEIFKDLGTK